MTGRLVLVARLAVRDLQRRKAEAALLLIAIAAATGTLTLGLALNGLTKSPYAYTKTRTSGPDVQAQSAGAAGDGGPPASLVALEHAQGVTGYSGPYPVAYPKLSAGGHNVPSGAFTVLGRDQVPAAVDQPKVTLGHWVRAREAPSSKRPTLMNLASAPVTGSCSAAGRSPWSGSPLPRHGPRSIHLG